MHMLIIAVVVVVFFGANKVPELMRGIGKGMGELQKGIDESKRMMTQAMSEVHDEPKPEELKYVAPAAEAPKIEATAEAPKVEAVKAEPPVVETKPSKTA